MTSSLLEERVLIVAPAGRDGRLLRDVLLRNRIAVAVCADVASLVAEAERGVGVAVLTEEALDVESMRALRDLHEGQPPWSDLPFILLVSDRPPYEAQLALAQASTFGNVTMLGRPVSLVEFQTAIRAALRSRRRQYEIRGYLTELKANSRAKDEFLAMLGHELRNPLAAVRNAVTTATIDETRRQRALAIAERQLQQLGSRSGTSRSRRCASRSRTCSTESSKRPGRPSRSAGKRSSSCRRRSASTSTPIRAGWSRS
jgi:signal transduction histidine kinase